MSLPRRLYEARRVSTASSSGTLVLSVGQSDCKEVFATDAVESQFFRHVLLLFLILETLDTKRTESLLLSLRPRGVKNAVPP